VSGCDEHTAAAVGSDEVTLPVDDVEVARGVGDLKPERFEVEGFVVFLPAAQDEVFINGEVRARANPLGAGLMV